MNSIQELHDWLAAHPSTQEVVAEIKGGDCTVRPDGTRVITMPWARYTPTIRKFWVALDATGWNEIDTGDYMAVVARWRASHRSAPSRADELARMDASTLCHALRWMNHAERFCDGSWASDFKAGIFHAGARAVLDIARRSEHPWDIWPCSRRNEAPVEDAQESLS